jgi:hypothetical protein
MDNFNYQAYLKSGRIHGEQAILTESEQVSEKKYKQGYDDREDESLGARRGAEKGKKQSMKDRRDDSYGKFGKRDAEKKGKNKVNKENVEEVGKGYFKKEHGVGKDSLKETIAEAKAKIDEGSYPFDQCLSDNEGKYGAKGAARVCGAIKAAYGEGIVNEDARTDAEQEGYKDGFDDAKDDIEGALKKMKVSELKDKIKTEILSNLSEAEEDVDVDIDVEDEVEVEAGADDIEIERPGVKAKVEVGLSPEEEIVQDSLKAAMDAAEALGSQKLADQIGNTITFFTREFVVGNNSD